MIISHDFKCSIISLIFWNSLTIDSLGLWDLFVEQNITEVNLIVGNIVAAQLIWILESSQYLNVFFSIIQVPMSSQWLLILIESIGSANSQLDDQVDKDGLSLTKSVYLFQALVIFNRNR